MKRRPGIRRSRVRSPELALLDLHEVMASRAPKKPPAPLAKEYAHRLRAWFYRVIRSWAARHMKDGL